MTSDLMLVEGPPKRWPLLRRVCIYYRTAKTFGLKSYHAVLLRADKVIDILHTQDGLTAPFNALVGQIDAGAFFLIGTSFSGVAATSGTLKLFFLGLR